MIYELIPWLKDTNNNNFITYNLKDKHILTQNNTIETTKIELSYFFNIASIIFYKIRFLNF